MPKKAAAIEINCETDFVARNDDFQAQAEKFLNTVYENDIEDLDTLMATEVEGVTVADHLQQMTGTIGEKIQISKVVLAKTDGSFVNYIHPGNQLGVIVEFDGTVENDEVAKDVAMQVAAMKPIAV